MALQVWKSQGTNLDDFVYNFRQDLSNILGVQRSRVRVECVGDRLAWNGLDEPSSNNPCGTLDVKFFLLPPGQDVASGGVEGPTLPAVASMLVASWNARSAPWWEGRATRFINFDVCPQLLYEKGPSLLLQPATMTLGVGESDVLTIKNNGDDVLIISGITQECPPPARLELVAMVESDPLPSPGQPVVLRPKDLFVLRVKAEEGGHSCLLRILSSDFTSTGSVLVELQQSWYSSRSVLIGVGIGAGGFLGLWLLCAICCCCCCRQRCGGLRRCVLCSRKQSSFMQLGPASRPYRDRSPTSEVESEDGQGGTGLEPRHPPKDSDTEIELVVQQPRSGHRSTSSGRGTKVGTAKKDKEQSWMAQGSSDSDVEGQQNKPRATSRSRRRSSGGGGGGGSGGGGRGSETRKFQALTASSSEEDGTKPGGRSWSPPSVVMSGTDDWQSPDAAVDLPLSRSFVMEASAFERLWAREQVR